MAEYLQGKFRPKNKKKYKGDVTNIVYRSGWELRVLKYLDENENVLEYSSEEIVIPYKSPVDGRVHRYFPDFMVKVRQADGNIKTLLLEVKPHAQTKEPKVSKRKTKRYITEVVTWGVNQAKWKSAVEYCKDRGWEFRLITEKELGIK